MLLNSQVLKLISMLIICCTFSATAFSQVCRTEAETPSSSPNTRFEDHGNGTVTDELTGLMWKKCSEGHSGNECSDGAANLFTWDAALQHTETVNTTGGFAGYGDWRMPNSAVDFSGFKLTS